MNYIITNFEQILEFAGDYGLPANKTRAILREYLQVKILDMIYTQRSARDIFFIGGTSLRLLKGLDRFSEDMDFEYSNDLSSKDIQTIIKNVHKQLEKENISVDLYQNTTDKRHYFELRFNKLLFELDISSHIDEKLAIKFDFESSWNCLTPGILLLNRYGFLVNVTTIPNDQFLVQKLKAYLNRKQTMPRDLYDIVWLISHKAKLDSKFMTKNQIHKRFVADALEKYQVEKLKIKDYKRNLEPFLFNHDNAKNIEFFAQMLEALK